MCCRWSKNNMPVNNISTIDWSPYSLIHALVQIKTSPSCGPPGWMKLSAAPVLVWSRPSWCRPGIWLPSSPSYILPPTRSRAVIRWLLCSTASTSQSLTPANASLPISQHPSLPRPRRCLHPSGQLQSGSFQGSSDNPVYHTHPVKQSKRWQSDQ